MNNDIPLNEYPRPQLVRESYLSLNGKWEYAISKSREIPKVFDGNIIVPFAIESSASLVNKKLLPDDYLFYKRLVQLPDNFIKDKLIIHFTAVDQIAEVYINGKFVTKHIGGYTPFSVDILPYLDNKNYFEIVVIVTDASDTNEMLRGKQSLNPHGIWYTASSGIYMPVWLESVSNDYISDIKYIPDIDNDILKIKVSSLSEKVVVRLLDRQMEITPNKWVNIPISNYKCWTPDEPQLYSITLYTHNDKVDSYFAMRKISLGHIDNISTPVIFLNNSPIFIKGVLDQGYYIDSLLTPKIDKDYINDIVAMKNMGFNTLRKHIKVESLRFYYHCDKLGMLVIQDFPSGGGKYKLTTISLPLITNIHQKDNKYAAFARKDETCRMLAKEEFKDIIDYLFNAPSIIMWTIFNEGWGQFDSKEIYNELKQIDSTRLYDHASGWHDQKISDVKSLHVYFKRVKIPKENLRAIYLSEAGGYSYRVEGHCYSDKSFGYKKLASSEELLKAYEKFIELDVIKNIKSGLCAFIYTQLSDVENETNGLLTYDREVTKVDALSMKNINDRVKF